MSLSVSLVAVGNLKTFTVIAALCDGPLDLHDYYYNHNLMLCGSFNRLFNVWVMVIAVY